MVPARSPQTGSETFLMCATSPMLALNLLEVWMTEAHQATGSGFAPQMGPGTHLMLRWMKLFQWQKSQF